jgi:AcrR family transcriptional regulator
MKTSGVMRAISRAVDRKPRNSEQRARRPSRKRGQLRFERLLLAAEALLLEHNPDEVGLYQIAGRAGVPPASVYHFFPTRNAALLALADQYHVDIRALVNAPVPAARLLSWQDLLIIRHERAVKYYNEHLAAAKVFLGIHPSWEIHQADKAYNRSASETLFAHFDRFFQMPYVQDPQAKLEVTYSIADAIWSISFERLGAITPQYFEEAVTACTAYCRTFLPDRVPPRDSVVDAAARGELLTLA